VAEGTVRAASRRVDLEALVRSAGRSIDGDSGASCPLDASNGDPCPGLGESRLRVQDVHRLRQRGTM
jgi:hypothetical protein